VGGVGCEGGGVKYDFISHDVISSYTYSVLISQVCMYIDIYSHIHTYMHTHAHTYTYTRICIFTYAHIYTHVHDATPFNPHSYMHTHAHTYTHIHIHTYMYDHICTHIHTCSRCHALQSSLRLHFICAVVCGGGEGVVGVFDCVAHGLHTYT